MSEEDIKKEGDPIRKLELGLQIESLKQPNTQIQQLLDQQSKFNLTDSHLKLNQQNQN